MINIIQVLVKASRPRTFILGISTVLFGTAAAAAHNRADLAVMVISILFAIFSKISLNLGRQYFDDKYNFGRSRVLGLYDTDAFLPFPRIMSEGCKTFAGLTLMCGLALFALSGWWSLVGMAILMALAAIYNFGKHPVYRKWFAPIFTFLIYGPAGVIFVELLESQRMSMILLNEMDLTSGIIGSIQMGLLAANLQLLSDTKYIDINRKAGIETMVQKQGLKRMLWAVVANTSVLLGVGIYAPFAMNMEQAWGYAPIPVIAFLLTMYGVYMCQRKPGSEKPVNLVYWTTFGYALCCLLTLWHLN